jgi:glycosyltransferase involved in cell wall biosynthesis
MRLAIVASHPIQYYAPIFRVLARRFDVKVFFAHRATLDDQAKAGFGVAFDWDVDLLSGYDYVFMRNISRRPGLDHFSGCDTPEITIRLAEARFDAVLVLGWHLKSFVQTLLAAKAQRLPLLVRGDSQLSTQRSTFKRIIKAVGYPMFLRLFDRALYVGQRSKEYWMHYHYPMRRLFFSPHCIDTEWFSSRATLESRHALRIRLGIIPDAKVALFAGKLVTFKRPLDVVAAAALLKSAGQQIVVLVAGSGPLQKEMIMAAHEARVEIHYLGFCNQTEMPAVYAASDCLVLPSDARETWGLVANESLACGRPIVLADSVGSAPDLAADRVVGRVFPQGDISALANALRSVVAHPPVPSVIAAKSEAYDLAAATKGIEAALISAVSERNRGDKQQTITENANH